MQSDKDPFVANAGMMQPWDCSATAHVTVAPTVHPHHCSLLFRCKGHIYNILIMILPGVLVHS